MSDLRNDPCPVNDILLMPIGSRSHVYFKKWPRRHIEFKGEEPRGVPLCMSKNEVLRNVKK